MNFRFNPNLGNYRNPQEPPRQGSPGGGDGNDKLIKILTMVLVGILLFFFIVVPLVVRGALPVVNRIVGMPDLSILDDYHPIGSIEVYDYQDKFVGVLQGKEDRQVVKLNQISPYAIQAVLAAEDSEFYKHGGFSLSSTARAMMSNMKAGRVVQGGSTITQQMVKNLFINEDERYKRTISRKVVELLISLEVESRYPKDKILEVYLNQVYFGNLAYGIERASQRYFSKPSSQLNIEEAAYLASLLTAPSQLSKDLKAAMQRQKYVLSKMLENGYISKKEYEKASKAKLNFRYTKGNFALFPYYFSYVEQLLAKRFNRNELQTIGLKIYTGLDPKAQVLAEQMLEEGIKSAASGINQGALVSIDIGTGQVRALVGGVGNFWEHQYNRAVNVHTIGSAFKPFVYLTAFMKGVVDPSTVIEDEEIRIPDSSLPSGYWIPQNFDEEFHGPITVKAAIVYSRNIPAVKVAMKTGIPNIIDTAKLAGIKTEMQPLLSLALGAQAFTPLEVADAYSTLARGGVHIEPIIIRKIVDTKGKVLEDNKAVTKNSLPERYVDQLVNILQDVVEYGTGAMAKIPNRPAAGKTGTADGSRDTWFIGFTTDYVTAVWCGNEKNREVGSSYATGGATPAWVWREFMTKYYEARPKPAKGFSFSEEYKLVAIDPLTGLLANEYTPNPVYKRFKPGTEPKDAAPVPEADKIKTRDKNDNKFYDLEKNVSKEDRDLKEASQLKNPESASQAATPTPKPKVFKIDEESKNQTKSTTSSQPATKVLSTSRDDDE